MGKSADRNTKTEFATLELVLVQTANEASMCLKALKRNLSEFDSRNGHHFRNTSKSYMRRDIRTAKDVAMDLKHVAHRIKKTHKHSKSEVDSARSQMDATTKAMEMLLITARTYDDKHGHATGVKAAIKHAVHPHGKHEKERDTHGEVIDKSDPYHQGNPGILGSSDTAEAVVKMTLRDNFNINVLSYHIATAEKSLSTFSVAGRAKVAMHEMKDKLKGDRSKSIHSGSSPVRGGTYANHSMTP